MLRRDGYLATTTAPAETSDWVLILVPHHPRTASPASTSYRRRLRRSSASAAAGSACDQVLLSDTSWAELLLYAPKPGIAFVGGSLAVPNGGHLQTGGPGQTGGVRQSAPVQPRCIAPRTIARRPGRYQG